MIKTINFFYCFDLSIKEDNMVMWILHSLPAGFYQSPNPQSKTDHTMYWSLYWFPYFFLTAYAKYIVEEVSN